MKAANTVFFFIYLFNKAINKDQVISPNINNPKVII